MPRSRFHMTKKWFFAAFAVLLVAGALVSGGQKPSTGRPNFSHETLIVTHKDGSTDSFDVEVATTTHEQAYGLMFVKDMPENAGMLFTYQAAREVAFWMKNTAIPLDMLFVLPDSTVGRIVRDARPFDMTPIQSQVPVVAVIELKGGVAKKKAIMVGDKVESPTIIPTL